MKQSSSIHGYLHFSRRVTLVTRALDVNRIIASVLRTRSASMQPTNNLNTIVFRHKSQAMAQGTITVPPPPRGAAAQLGPLPPHSRDFCFTTQRRITVGRTSLDE